MDWKYILKRVIIGVAIAVIIMLIKGNLFIGVSARTISMDVPDNFGYYTTNGQSTQNTLTSQQATLNNYVNIPSYRSQLIPQNSHGGLAYEWVNANLCVNDDLTISGVVHAPTITSVTWASGYFNSWTEQKSCDMFSVSNGYRFTCSGTGGGGFVVYFGYQNDNGYGGYMYLERDMDIYCNATANDIISNANNNTTQIINNNNENTQNIINNQNENTEKEIESQKVCKRIIIDKDKTLNSYRSLNSSGEIQTSSYNFGVTDFYSVNSSSTLKVIQPRPQQGGLTCFYKSDFSVITGSCFDTSQLSANSSITIPSTASYFRSTIYITSNVPVFEFNSCQNGNQALQDSITDDSIDSSTGNDFFDNFNYGDDSLSAVITAPLRFFNSLTTTCSPLSLPVFTQTITIPCGDTVFWSRSEVSTFRSWWNLFFGGIAIYYLGLKLFKVVHDAIDPEKDNIESVGV